MNPRGPAWSPIGHPANWICSASVIWIACAFCWQAGQRSRLHDPSEKALLRQTRPRAAAQDCLRVSTVYFENTVSLVT
jgi:hypothetical protein